MFADGGSNNPTGLTRSSCYGNETEGCGSDFKLGNEKRYALGHSFASNNITRNPVNQSQSEMLVLDAECHE